MASVIEQHSQEEGGSRDVGVAWKNQLLCLHCFCYPVKISPLESCFAVDWLWLWECWELGAESWEVSGRGRSRDGDGGMEGAPSFSPPQIQGKLLGMKSLDMAGPLKPRRKPPGSGRESPLKGNGPINKSRQLKNETWGLGEEFCLFPGFFFPPPQLKQTKLPAQAGAELGVPGK